MLPKRASLLATFETRLDASMVAEHEDEGRADDDDEPMPCVGRLT